MSLPTLTIRRLYASRQKWRKEHIDAVCADVEAWASQIVANAADKSTSQTISGPWTINDLVLGNNRLTRTTGELWTLPAAGSAQNVVGTSATQTLTNKTLTSPSLTTPTITDPTMIGTVTVPAADPPGANALTKQSLIKAWAFITWNATVPEYTASFNTSGTPTDTATGDVALTWNTPFANANYAVVATALDVGGADHLTCHYVSKTATGCSIRIRNRSAGALTDPTSICVIAVGGQ